MDASAFLHLGFGLFHGRDNIGICGTTAYIAAHILADVCIRAGMPLPDAGHTGHDLPRGTVTALKGIVIDERLLHWMEAISIGEPLNCGDLVPLRRDGECQA